MAKYKVLDDFYASKEWVDFRRAYIKARLIQDKGHLCDYCDGWIDTQKEIELHHEKELTPDNVHDPIITLAEDNIKQLHKGCHNKIHKHAAAREKRVTIVYGPPLSGKNSYVKRKMWEGDIVVDMDLLFMAISGLDLYNKPDTLFNNVIGIQELLLDHIKTRYGTWDNAWIVGGFPEKYRRNQLAEQMGASVVFMDVTEDECIRRLREDTSKRSKVEWAGYIHRWFDRHTK